MALKLIDSGDGQRTYDSSKWNRATGSPSFVAAPTGYSGTWFQLGSSGQRSCYFLSYAGDTLIVGFRVELPSTPPGVTPLAIFGEHDGVTVTQHIYISVGGDGFRIHRSASNDTLLLGPAGTPFSWGSGVRYIEIKIKVHDTLGDIEIREDEVTLYHPTGFDTKNSTAGICNLFSVLSANASNGTANWKFRDVYVCGSDGGANNDFLGVSKTGAKLVTGAGNSAQFTPSAGSNFQNVDDGTTVDNDTTYNASQTVNQIDSFALGSSGLPSGAVIRGAQSNIVARKDDVDPRVLAPLIRSGGTNFPQTNFTLGSTFQLIRQIHETDPNTSAAFTQANLDAIELGYKLIS